VNHSWLLVLGGHDEERDACVVLQLEQPFLDRHTCGGDAVEVLDVEFQPVLEQVFHLAPRLASDRGQ
jgi:hypothetical protein